MATYKLVDSDKLDAAMTATADAIRAKTGSTDPIAWDAEKGMSEAVDPVFEAGKKSEYDAFWDAYQDNGTMRDYRYAFAGVGWNLNTFNPKYSIDDYIISGAYMFYYTRNLDIDLVEFLKERNKVIIVKPFNDINYCFSFSKITRVGEISLLETNSSQVECFGNSEVKTIDLIRIKENTALDYMFRGATKLENILFEGVIGNNINLQWCERLTKNTIINIIETLSINVENKPLILSQTAVNTAFETTAGAADGSTSEEWTTLIATKPNWTISLV